MVLDFPAPYSASSANIPVVAWVGKIGNVSAIYLKALIYYLAFGMVPSSKITKGEDKIKVTCTQGRQKFKLLRKGDYFVKSNEHGEEKLAKFPD